MDKFQQIKQLLRLQGEAVSEKPLRIELEPDQDTSMLPKGKKITCLTITPAKTITWFAINPLLLQIDKEDLEKMRAVMGKDFHPEASELFSKYAKLIIKIIALGIINKGGEFPKWMPEFLAKNFTWADLLVFLREITARLGSQSFCSSITMLKNVSPMDEAEMIALQKNQESWIQPNPNLNH